MRCRNLAFGAVLLGLAAPILAHPAQAGPWRANEGNTRGWMLMTPQERIEHQARVRGFTDYAACQSYRAEHHALMVQRAREKDLTLPDQHWDFCEHLKRGARTAPD